MNCLNGQWMTNQNKKSAQIWNALRTEFPKDFQTESLPGYSMATLCTEKDATVIDSKEVQIYMGN